MKLYLDADIFLALTKEEDRHKKTVQQFLSENKQHQFFTSNLTCLEMWFYLYRNGLKEEVLKSILAVKAIATIIDYGITEIEQGVILAQKCGLSPADAIHATIAQRFDGIVSSDHSFDKISGLKRIDFSQEMK